MTPILVQRSRSGAFGARDDRVGWVAAFDRALAGFEALKAMAQAAATREAMTLASSGDAR
jgi:hypothetical protein